MDSPPASVFLQFAERATAEVNSALDRYTTYDDDCPARLRDAIRHSLLAPGKRLRPLLVLMAAEACGCEIERAMPAACAVEMVHTYSLIHDDLPAMDDDSLRRGRPTCHVQFDEATAILAGDALLTQAFEVLAGDIKPPQTAARCCLELARAAGASSLVGGQVDDLFGSATDGSLEKLQRIHRRKTGAMFEVSLRLGGIVAAAADEEMAALVNFGKKLGLAFQIIDDLLDVGGQTADLGKSVGKDVKQNKATFPALLGVNESRRRATDLIGEAQAAVTIFGQKAEPLSALATYVLERKH